VIGTKGKIKVVILKFIFKMEAILLEIWQGKKQ
jgi:hypothetical protein